MTTDAKLKAAARNKLPDSAFCYVAGSGDNKVRKFPAHDASHVRNGLARLNQADISASAKQKVLACLKRKAKRFGVKVSDEICEGIETLDPTYRMGEDFTQEEIEAWDKLFADNPNIDELEEEEPKQPESKDDTSEDEDGEKDVNSMKKNELVDYANNLKEEMQRGISARDEKIQGLEAQLQQKDTILIERENEINKYLDDNAVLNKKYKDAIIENLVDLKIEKDLKREDLIKKFEGRTLTSLIDALSDLRNELNPGEEPEEKVSDPSITDTKDEQKQTDQNEKGSEDDSDWDPFSLNDKTEVE